MMGYGCAKVQRAQPLQLSLPHDQIEAVHHLALDLGVADTHLFPFLLQNTLSTFLPPVIACKQLSKCRCVLSLPPVFYLYCTIFASCI